MRRKYLDGSSTRTAILVLLAREDGYAQFRRELSLNAGLVRLSAPVSSLVNGIVPKAWDVFECSSVSMSDDDRIACDAKMGKQCHHTHRSCLPSRSASDVLSLSCLADRI